MSDALAPNLTNNRPGQEEGLQIHSKAGFLASVRADLLARKSPRPVLFNGLLSLFSRGFHAVLLYRISHLVRFSRILSGALRRLNALWTGAELHENAEIGPGLVLPHPRGVVVGKKVRIGMGVYLHQGVILGPNTGEEEPTIGNNVRIYPYACVLDGSYIGQCSQVGANTVVLESCPPGSVVMPPTPVVFKGIAFSMRNYSAQQWQQRWSSRDAGQ